MKQQYLVLMVFLLMGIACQNEPISEQPVLEEEVSSEILPLSIIYVNDGRSLVEYEYDNQNRVSSILSKSHTSILSTYSIPFNLDFRPPVGFDYDLKEQFEYLEDFKINYKIVEGLWPKNENIYYETNEYLGTLVNNNTLRILEPELLKARGTPVYKNGSLDQIQGFFQVFNSELGENERKLLTFDLIYDYNKRTLEIKTDKEEEPSFYIEFDDKNSFDKNLNIKSPNRLLESNVTKFEARNSWRYEENNYISTFDYNDKGFPVLEKRTYTHYGFYLEIEYQYLNE